MSELGQYMFYELPCLPVAVGELLNHSIRLKFSILWIYKKTLPLLAWEVSTPPEVPTVSFTGFCGGILASSCEVLSGPKEGCKKLFLYFSMLLSEAYVLPFSQDGNGFLCFLKLIGSPLYSSWDTEPIGYKTIYIGYFFLLLLIYSIQLLFFSKYRWTLGFCVYFSTHFQRWNLFGFLIRF